MSERQRCHDAYAEGSSARIRVGVTCAYLKNMQMKGNTLNRLSGAGVEIGPLNASNNLEIEGNVITD
ncbi:hypothetical protein [Bradyrhizobium macuxiense]|uniref:hypothetical protein n=1 Tax=Bradyrhizobium macuxiense TaxID=1755647 RepID=UPI000ADE7486|nr:hypothetical protein [Bradyrhizobium macuxiense]